MNRAAVQGIEPVLHRAARGWLAVSKPGSRLKIGVIGETQAEAKAKFKVELAAWAELSERKTRK